MGCRAQRVGTAKGDAMKELIVRKRGSDWWAGDTGVTRYGCGRTPAEAIAQAVIFHPDFFGIRVTFEPVEADSEGRDDDSLLVRFPNNTGVTLENTDASLAFIQRARKHSLSAFEQSVCDESRRQGLAETKRMK